MNKTNFEKLDLDDGNGHEWYKIVNNTNLLVGKTVCKKCGYLRRIDENAKPLNNACKGPVKITLR